MSKPEHLNTKKTINKDGIHEIYYRDFSALILTPALGYPAVIKKKGDGKEDVWLEIMMLGEDDDLTPSDVAFHLRFCDWGDKDKASSYDNTLKLFDDFAAKVNIEEKFEDLITISKPVANTMDSFGTGVPKKENIFGDHEFTMKCSNSLLFQPVQEQFSTFQYVYKVAVNLKYETMAPGKMYNLRWLNKQDHTITKGKPVWFNCDKERQTLLVGKEFKQELKEYGGDVKEEAVDSKNKERHKNNIKIYLYHPFYVSKKEKLNIGHVTDIHMDSRMDVYAQSEASVIEVKENCPPKFNSTEREVTNGDFHAPIKNKIANFNNIFTDVSEKLFNEGGKDKSADVLIITGDLVDYNRGIHTDQTHKKKPDKISKMWKSLGSDVSEDDFYKDDRNWFTFYERLLDLYDTQKKPIFTMLGNHEAVNFGMAPWPLAGAFWNGAFDQNLTLYESAICFGPGYTGNKAFVRDLLESYKYVEWYMFFINPFSDFVFEYGEQSIYIVDWGDGSSVVAPGLNTAVVKPVANTVTAAVRAIVPPLNEPLSMDAVGSLHHAKNVFKKKNYDIYKSWLADAKEKKQISMLFMHATSICPRDDISIGEIDYNFKWSDKPLQYGSFDGSRKRVIQDVENGDLRITVGGHSHRNIIMNVHKDKPFKAEVIGSGTTFGTITTIPENLAIVTSSCGPFPKCVPGGPLICACQDKYDTGWDYQGDSIYNDGTFYGYHKYDKNGKVSHLTTRYEISPPECPDCRMPAKKMVRKITKRHRPGGNLLRFDDKGNIQIKSVFTTEGPDARIAVMSDENDFFTQQMKLEDIRSFEEYQNWYDEDLLSIISEEPFELYGSLDFPNKVQYVTFKEKGLRGKERHNVETEYFDKHKTQVRQFIDKDSFDILMRAGLSRSDFAFMRYEYIFASPPEAWDREIKMFKGLSAKLDPRNVSFNKRSSDPFKGLLIKYLRKADLDKRKKICEY